MKKYWSVDLSEKRQKQLADYILKFSELSEHELPAKAGVYRRADGVEIWVSEKASRLPKLIGWVDALIASSAQLSTVLSSYEYAIANPNFKKHTTVH